MERPSLSELLAATDEVAQAHTFHAQFTRCKERETKGGKPYLELTFADATGEVTIKAWENHPDFAALRKLQCGALVAVTGQFTQNKWGLDGSPWSLQKLAKEDAAALFAGSGELAQRQREDYETIRSLVGSLREPRLKSLCEVFLQEHGERFRRTAAARKNHHARRGGLVEHVAQMMRSADALSKVYQNLNRDLVLAGVLFHDCGKLWENCYPEEGFVQTPQLHGEMMGHIPLGMELVNKLWRQLQEQDGSIDWKAAEEVRLHLLHLVASHHGTHEFGSPVLPRTPEAYALHFIDNLDAKLEMVKDGYQAAEVIPGVYERRFPLAANLVEPLPSQQGELFS